MKVRELIALALMNGNLDGDVSLIDMTTKNNIDYIITSVEKSADGEIGDLYIFIEMDAEKRRVLTNNLNKLVEELETSVRTTNCLKHMGMVLCSQLVERTEKEYLSIDNFGRKSLNELKDVLAEMDLSIGMNLKGYSVRREFDIITSTLNLPLPPDVNSRLCNWYPTVGHIVRQWRGISLSEEHKAIVKNMLAHMDIYVD